MDPRARHRTLALAGVRADFNPADHPHAPAGTPIGGQFISKGGGVRGFLHSLSGLAEGEEPGAFWFDEGGDVYIDWSAVTEGGDLRSFELTDADGETATFKMSEARMARLYEAMSIDRIRDTEDPQERAQLVDAMLAVNGGGAFQFGIDYPKETEAGYWDWSTRTPDGGYRLDAEDEDGNAVSINMTAEQFTQLHAQFGLTVLGT